MHDDYELGIDCVRMYRRVDELKQVAREDVEKEPLLLAVVRGAYVESCLVGARAHRISFAQPLSCSTTCRKDAELGDGGSIVIALMQC